MTNTLFADPMLKAGYEALVKAHSSFLAKYGVTLPGPDTQQALALICLFQHKGKLVSLEALRAFVRKHVPEGSHDIQPRHLKYAGWHVLLSGKSNDILPLAVAYVDSQGKPRLREAHEKLPNGYILLVSETSPSPDFVLRKRRGSLDRSSWESLVASCDSRCVVCREKKAHLEKGHKDPSKGYELDNIIPMCSECNNWASSDVIFDDSGRIIALASPRFVKAASLEVKLLIFHELRRDRFVNPGGR